MLTSLAFVFLAGLAMGWLSRRLHLPRIIGMLTTGEQWQRRVRW